MDNIKITKYFITLFFVIFILSFLFTLNESHYSNSRMEMLFYARDGSLIESSDLSRDYYVNKLKEQLENKNFENINVRFIGKNLYGFENIILIEGTPPATSFDKLINRNIKPIRIEYKFLNLGI